MRTLTRQVSQRLVVSATVVCVLGPASGWAQNQPYYPPQNAPQQNVPQQGFPQQGFPQQGFPQQGAPQQGFPQQGGQGGPGPGGQFQGGGGGNPLDQLMEWERQDMGVRPTRDLYAGAMHGPTPNQIPGGQLITTKGLVPLLQGGTGVRAVVLDVLGAPQQLPNAIAAVPAAQAGNFRDQTQQQFGQMLQQVTNGNRDTPIVTYCQGPQCWMSYNAALRAINLGYKNVLWYRGGLEAWQRAGLPVSTVQTGFGPPSGGGQPQPYGGGNNPYGGQPPYGGGGGQPPYGAQPNYGGPPPQGGFGTRQ
jgi:PQQ-dependent catabolism-associated CXXCW motif protein